MAEQTKAVQVTVEEIILSLPQRANPEMIKGVEARLGYNITGQNGGQWTVEISKGQVSVQEGLNDPQVTTIIADQDWIDVTLGRLDGMTAFSSGKLKVEGDLNLLTNSTKFFKKFVPGSQDQEEKQVELVALKQVLSIPQRFSTGPVMGKFLNGLKEKKILANKCPKCGRLQIPPREVCAECKVRAVEWVEVGPEGEIATPDVVYYASPDPLTGQSRETPYIAAHFLLDGCKGHETLWHDLKPDTDLKYARRGVRVRPVWNEKRVGAITDILYFEVVK